MSVATDLGPWGSDVDPFSRIDPPLVGVRLARLEAVIARPAGSGAWWSAFQHHLDELVDALHRESHQIEGPDGLHQDILEEQPRLSFQVRRLEEERAQLIRELALLRMLVSACRVREGGIAVALTATTDVVARLRGHRDRDDAVLHETYRCDLGVGD